MGEIIFLVEDAVESGYTARALGHSIFTEAETMDVLRQHVREAIECHFEQSGESAPILGLAVKKVVENLERRGEFEG